MITKQEGGKEGTNISQLLLQHKATALSLTTSLGKKLILRMFQLDALVLPMPIIEVLHDHNVRFIFPEED